MDISFLWGSKPQAAYVVILNQTQVPMDVRQLHVYYLRKCSQLLLGSGGGTVAWRKLESYREGHFSPMLA